MQLPLVLGRVWVCVGALLLAGCGNPSFLVTPVYPSANLEEYVVQPAPAGEKGPGGKIAIIELEGLILNARTGGLLQAQENPVNRFVESLNRAASDKEVKAVVLRINSPGGGVAASDTLYEEVQRFRTETGKPVIASVQDVGASGAYYVACAADVIVVQPTSVVGSIGVIFQTLNVSGTMSRIGVTSDAIKSGPNKDAGSPLRTMTADERLIFQSMIDDFYGRFKDVVRKRPGDTRVTDEAVAFDGRVMPGDRAVAIGLADQTGSLHDALALARERGKAPRARAVMYKLPFSEQGSIYASAPVPPPTANTYSLRLPVLSDTPTGFYYLWQP
jgi:protease-4